MLDVKIITLDLYKLSLLEELPQKPHQLPQHAPHLLNYIEKNGINGKKHQTSIDFGLQLSVNKLIRRHSEKMRRNQNEDKFSLGKTRSGGGTSNRKASPASLSDDDSIDR